MGRKVPLLTPTNPDEIRIPLPSYSYGACRRARFAFGRISASQARTNTAEHIRQNTPDVVQDPWEDMVPEPEIHEQELEEDISRNEEILDLNYCA